MKHRKAGMLFPPPKNILPCSEGLKDSARLYTGHWSAGCQLFATMLLFKYWVQVYKSTAARVGRHSSTMSWLTQNAIF
eukprot:365123-Chlamydomonas_euryale.AAC.32